MKVILEAPLSLGITLPKFLGSQSPLASMVTMLFSFFILFSFFLFFAFIRRPVDQVVF